MRLRKVTEYKYQYNFLKTDSISNQCKEDFLIDNVMRISLITWNPIKIGCLSHQTHKQTINS